MQKPYVFISYSTKDQELADKVNQTLKDNGINTWIATEDIHGGDSFATEITNGIKNCDAFIFVLSQNSDNSPHCGNELSMAFSGRKKIIPFRLHEFNLSESNTYFLQQAQWIDYFAGEDWAFQELIKQLKLALFSEKVENTAVKSAPATTNKHVDNLIVRAELELETKSFGFASRYANEALNEDATNFKAYLILLLCDCKVSSLEELIVSNVDFSNNTNYQRVLRFANDEDKKYIEEKFENGRKLIKQAELEKKKKEDEALIKKIQKGGCKNSKITSITIPSVMTELLGSAFENCGKLKSVIFEDGSQLTTIDDSAFSGCSSLTSIKIPKGVEKIGYQAFCDCVSLTSVEIPDSVNFIDFDAFSNCTSLKSINVDKNNEDYKSIDGNLYSKDGETLVQYAVGKTESSFTVPSSVSTIESGALSCCKSLVNINVDEGNEYYKSIDGNLYSQDENGLTLVQYALGKTETSFTVPNGVTSIQNSALWQCSSLENVEISDSVESIERDAFYFCTSLKNVTFGENSQLKNIDVSAFQECVALENIAIPNGVTTIEEYTFAGCTSLISVEIPDSVKSIGYDAFGECNPDLVIYGKTGSCAQEYADENDIKFIDKELIRKQQEQEELERKEQEQIEKQKALRQSNLCQHCGGKFKGLFKKVCSNCGKEKDY